MTSKRTKPNFSMYLPEDVRDDIDKLINENRYSSVAAFLISSARIHIDMIKINNS